jgi:hypothetical protein
MRINNLSCSLRNRTTSHSSLTQRTDPRVGEGEGVGIGGTSGEGDGLGDTSGEGDGLPLGSGEGEGVGLADGEGDALGLGLGEGRCGVGVACAIALATLLPSLSALDTPKAALAQIIAAHTPA